MGNFENNQQKSIQHIINNKIVDAGNVSIATAIEAINIAYQEIIEMIELDFDTGYAGLGLGLSDAQRIINRIEDLKHK